VKNFDLKFFLHDKVGHLSRRIHLFQTLPKTTTLLTYLFNLLLLHCFTSVLVSENDLSVAPVTSSTSQLSVFWSFTSLEWLSSPLNSLSWRPQWTMTKDGNHGVWLNTPLEIPTPFRISPILCREWVVQNTNLCFDAKGAYWQAKVKPDQ